MASADASSVEPVASGTEPPPPYVVGIGASTGGIAALQVLLQSMPAAPGFACVIVVHLSPEHESHLAELLQPHTAMPVQQVAGTTAIEPDHVYVIPPNANLTAVDSHLRLAPLEPRRSQRAPIDHFLRTLAAARDSCAVGVILSGNGSDGALGLRHIRQGNGLAIVQDPLEAEADGMPRSALATGMVDRVLPLRQIAGEIVRFCSTRPQLYGGERGRAAAGGEPAQLREILEALHERTGHDFATYTSATLRRRLRRRMQLAHVTTLAAYRELLRAAPEELDRLADDVSLTVTEFFSEPQVDAALESHVLPGILAGKSQADPRVRLWSFGCATGEEAYALGMLLLEARTRLGSALQVQVFATEVSPKILETARLGLYPREIAESVSPERVRRFFTPENGSYRVARELRDIIVFAAHDLFRDPPFARIDLILCRTVLTRLRPEIRRGILRLFHYALAPGGLLLVGPQDPVDLPELFRPEPAGSVRLFRRQGDTVRGPWPAHLRPFGPLGVRGAGAITPARSLGDPGELFHVAVEGYAPPSILIDAEDQILHASPAAGRYLHLTGGEPSTHLPTLLPEPVRTQLLEALPQVRRRRERWTSGPICIAAGEAVRTVVLHVDAVSVPGMLLVVLDDRLPAAPRDEQALERASVLEQLTVAREELRAVQEELAALEAENHQRIRQLALTTADLQHFLDSTGVALIYLASDLRIMRFTPLARELFGLRDSDVGRPVTDLARLPNTQTLQADVRRALDSQEAIDREVLAANGRWYLERIRPGGEGRRPEALVMILIDIHQRKQAELQLLQANRQKDDFLAVLAHELRNPLAPIRTGLEILQQAPGDRHRVERITATLSRQTGQLIRLVEDLLDLSRIKGGKLQLRLADLDLTEVVRDALAMCGPAIEQAHHRVEVDLPDVPLWVRGDGARLTQVLVNLLGNAVRYTPSPGRIRVAAHAEGALARVTVRDNGIGITPESLQHVFDMFYQARDARASPGGGLGIGLSLARMLVEAHGGSIAAHSGGPGAGSEFAVTLPRSEGARSAAAAPPAAAHRAATPHRILIVDDNADAADMLAMLLKSIGPHEVSTASSGPQALDLARRRHPEIVLLDLSMPGMDGYEVARHLRRESWGRQLRLIALSGWGQDVHRRRTAEAGFDHHLTKPVDVDTLNALIEAPA